MFYRPEEKNDLVALLRSKRVVIKELAEKLELKDDQVRLLINKFLNEGKVKGVFTADGAFIPDSIVKAKMNEYERAVQKLTSLFSRGEISEDSYKTSLRSLEEEIKEFREKKEEPSEVSVSEQIKPVSKPALSTNQLIAIGIISIIVLAILFAPTIMRSLTPKIETVVIEINAHPSLEWQGSIGDVHSSHSVQGYGYKTYTLHREGQDPWIVTAVVQMQDWAYGRSLTVQIVTSDGKVLASKSTTADFGVVTVSWSG